MTALNVLRWQEVCIYVGTSKSICQNIQRGAKKLIMLDLTSDKHDDDNASTRKNLRK